MEVNMSTTTVTDPSMVGPFDTADLAFEHINECKWPHYLIHSIREESDGHYIVWSYHTTTTLLEA